jgi:2-oxoglutarate dehydrogenase E2 component (dihydrolipoamide succinyltransferase)
MKVEIKVPAMGESISQVVIGTFLKKTGESVVADDELLELETDKVNQVLYAPEAGVVSWNVAEGDVVSVGQVIGVVDTDKKGAVAAPAAAKSPTKVIPAVAPAVAPAPATEGFRQTKEAFLVDLSAPTLPQPSTTPTMYLTEAKPEAVAPKVASPRPQASVAPVQSGERETRKKMSSIRRVIAKRLVEVLQETAMLTTFNEVDMSAIMKLREVYKELFTKKHNARLGFMSFFVKAAVAALKEFPDLNAYISGDDIVYRNYYDIGIAVSTDRGLVVPVVRNCDALSFAGIEQAIESYAKKAREGGLTPHDLQGGGFTITNGGTYGSLLSTPILNPPQSAILGMHKISKRAVVVDDAIVIRPMMYLALSYDHRVIDGKEAVSFLVHMKNCLEDPSRIFLDV